MKQQNHPAFIQGASRGIGLELVRQYLAEEELTVFASCRRPNQAPELQALVQAHTGRLTVLHLDVTQEDTIAECAAQIASTTDTLGLTINVSGVLHGPDFGPEKKLAQVDPENLRKVFEVNAFGPLLVAKHLHPLLRHGDRSTFASLSARVGSISDNRLGGWYAYRGSKAAQNMFTKTLSIEMSRVAPNAIVVGLHPGTVATDLSKPFQRAVPADQLFTAARSARSLRTVIARLRPEDTGKVFAWDGSEIPA